MGTVTILIIIALGIFAFAAWGVVTLEKYEKDYVELEKFIDECDNTAENFDIAKGEAIKLIHSKFIAERDCQSLRKKIYNKFLLL
jgi:hypothetical protein